VFAGWRGQIPAQGSKKETGFLDQNSKIKLQLPFLAEQLHRITSDSFPNTLKHFVELRLMISSVPSLDFTSAETCWMNGLVMGLAAAAVTCCSFSCSRCKQTVQQGRNG
jgi:hypothetical protein